MIRPPTNASRHKSPAQARILLLLLLLGWPAARAAQPLEITDVRADPRYFLPSEGQTSTLRFRLSVPAVVTTAFYDGRDRLIRTLGAQRLTAGEHTFSWDGTDQAGRPLPSEEYRYTLVGEGPDGERVTHDLTDLTAGVDVHASDVAWDASAGMIRYRLPQPARVNIRVGLRHDGPLLATVLDWVVRDAGLHQEPWNGHDASGVLDLRQHPELMIAVDAFALSANTVLIGPPPSIVQTLAELPWGETRRIPPPQSSPAKRMHFHSQQPLMERGDFTVRLRVPPELPSTPEGWPILAGEVPIQLDIAPHDRERALARRFETVFFVDGLFAFENEVGFLPMTWRWNSTGVNPGPHFLTANLRGYEGNFGVATLKVYVQPESVPANPTPSPSRMP